MAPVQSRCIWDPGEQRVGIEPSVVSTPDVLKRQKGFGLGQVGVCLTVALAVLEVSLWWGGFVTDLRLGAMVTPLGILAGHRLKRTQIQSGCTMTQEYLHTLLLLQGQESLAPLPTGKKRGTLTGSAHPCERRKYVGVGTMALGGGRKGMTL